MAQWSLATGKSIRLGTPTFLVDVSRPLNGCYSHFVKVLETAGEIGGIISGFAGLVAIRHVLIEWAKQTVQHPYIQRLARVIAAAVLFGIIDGLLMWLGQRNYYAGANVDPFLRLWIICIAATLFTYVNGLTLETFARYLRSKPPPKLFGDEDQIQTERKS